MRTHSKTSGLYLVLSSLFIPLLAQAHSGFHGAGFVHGVLHPLSGLDHICAMVAVGLWAAQRGGRAIWMVPLAFVSMMLLGGMLGLVGVALPHLETGIMLSVLVLGLLVAAAIELPVAVSAIIVGLFAIFHGFAHTVETPMNVSAMTYDFGFILSTASLHAVGIGFGLLMSRFEKISLVRYAGAMIAAFGAFLLLS